MDVLEPEPWEDELVQFKEADGKLTLGVDEVVGVVMLTDETTGGEDETTDNDDDDPVGGPDDDGVGCFGTDEELEFEICLCASSTRFVAKAASS